MRTKGEKNSESRDAVHLGERRQDGWVTKEIVEEDGRDESHCEASSGQLHACIKYKTEVGRRGHPVLIMGVRSFPCFLFIFCFSILFEAKIIQMPLPYSYFIHILGIL